MPHDPDETGPVFEVRVEPHAEAKAEATGIKATLVKFAPALSFAPKLGLSLWGRALLATVIGGAAIGIAGERLGAWEIADTDNAVDVVAIVEQAPDGTQTVTLTAQAPNIFQAILAEAEAAREEARLSRLAAERAEGAAINAAQAVAGIPDAVVRAVLAALPEFPPGPPPSFTAEDRATLEAAAAAAECIAAAASGSPVTC